MKVWAEHGHPYGCECEECKAEYERRTDGLTTRQMRREAGCRLAEFDEEIEHLADIYITTLADSEAINLLEVDCIYQDIARVGDRVVRQRRKEQREEREKELERENRRRRNGR